MATYGRDFHFCLGLVFVFGLLHRLLLHLVGSSPIYDSVGRDPDRLPHRFLRLPGHSRRWLLPHRPRLPDFLLPGAVDHHQVPWRDCRGPGK